MCRSYRKSTSCQNIQNFRHKFENMEQFIFYILLINLVLSLFFYKKQVPVDRLYFFPFIPLAIAAASAYAQHRQAEKQKDAAAKALNRRNPALDSATNQSQALANSSRYAGQDVDEANVRQATADTFNNISKASRSSGDILNAGARLQNQQAKGYQAIAQGAAGFRQSAAEKYRQMLLQQAGQLNDNYQYSEALKGASQQNNYNAVQTLAGGAAMAFGNQRRGGAFFPGMNNAPATQQFGNGSQSTWGWNPDQFSSYQWNPQAFSAGGSFR